MIRAITIENLRGIRRCRIEGLAQVNILIGKNGAGKSTVLEAVYVASAWVQPQDPLRGEYKLEYIVKRRAGRGKWASAKQVLWHLMDVDADVTIRLDIGGSELDLRLLPLGDARRAVARTHGASTYYCYAADSLIERTPSGFSARPAFLREEIARKLGTKLLDFLGNGVLIDSRLLDNPGMLETVIWPKLLAKRQDKEIVKILKEGYEPETEGLTYMPVTPGSYTLAIQLSRTTVRVDDLGDRARHAVMIAAVALTAGKTAILLEDPETHQHPGGLATLMDFLLRVAKSKGQQLFITTYSIELIDIARHLCERHGIPMKTYYLERSPEGIVDVRELERVDLEVCRKLGLDPRFLHVV